MASVQMYPVGEEVSEVAEGEEAESAASPDELNFVVAQIRRITRSANLEFALRVGGVIIHHFYGGKTAAWRARGAKSVSFRQLARHPDLPLSAGALSRCVAIFELCERLDAPSRWQHVGASHLRMVLALPPDVQERLLAAANQHRWTVSALQAAIARERTGRSHHRGGRRPQPVISKRLKAFNKCLEENIMVLHELPIVSVDELQQSVRMVQRAREYLDRLTCSIQLEFSRCAAECNASNDSPALEDNHCISGGHIPST